MVEAAPGHYARCVLYYPDAEAKHPDLVRGVREAAQG